MLRLTILLTVLAISFFLVTRRDGMARFRVARTRRGGMTPVQAGNGSWGQ